MIVGINHVTLAVRDLERAFRFYTEALKLRPVARWYTGAYLLAGRDWICLTLDPTRHEGALPEYTHTALTISTADFNSVVASLQALGVESWQANRSPGASFYFLDPDGHKLELHVAFLSDRLEHLQANPPEGLILFEQ